MRFVEEDTSVEKYRERLLEAKRAILASLNKIQEDRSGKTSGPLDPDWEEQATQLQSDEVLDQLDNRERLELTKIDAALDRIERGVYGKCVSCGEEIEEKRLTALPTATECIECLEEREQGETRH